jgi:DNA-binding MarR family transcriptional regulator
MQYTNVSPLSFSPPYGGSVSKLSGPVAQLLVTCAVPTVILIRSGLTTNTMRLGLDEIQLNILRLLNDKWYENPIAGLSFHDLVTQLGVEDTKVTHSVEVLVDNGLARRSMKSIQREANRYVITADGIDVHEETLPPSQLRRKLQERREILEKLKIEYDKEPHRLLEPSGDNANNYTLGVVTYLDQKGLVYLDPLVGLSYRIRLNARGAEYLKDRTIDNAAVMSCAYKILFELENHLKQFIEKNMRTSYGSDWWNSGYIPLKVRANVDKLIHEELSSSWQISDTNIDTEYLQFGNIGNIIFNNWKDCFEQFFHDQIKIIPKLEELEKIRNSIAHTRMLSQEGSKRLEMYSQEIENMMNSNPI